MKLYHTIRPHVETIFASNLEGEALKRQAEEFILEESRNHRNTNIQIKEISKVEDIPKGWDESNYIWNVDEEISAQEWLHKQYDAKEYQEYLRLKEKFG